MASSAELQLGPYFFLSLCVVCWIVDPSTPHQLECDTSTNQKQQVLLGLCYVRQQHAQQALRKKPTAIKASNQHHNTDLCSLAEGGAAMRANVVVPYFCFITIMKNRV